jgi:ligand-binding SRPBCC domain-containing protein
MKFKITSAVPQNGIYEGQIITYKVSPILNIPLSWMTEITHIEPNKRFIDEQRIGPYTLWHHEHWFEVTDNGVLMTDIVYYQLPLYFIGYIAHLLFIKQQLNNIFDFRYRKIEELFNKR